MSKLSTFFVSIESSVAESLLTGTFTNTVSSGIVKLLATNSALTEKQVIETVNNDLTTYLSDAIVKLPGYESTIAEVLLTVGTPAIQNWVDSIVSQAYNKIVSQLSGVKTTFTVSTN